MRLAFDLKGYYFGVKGDWKKEVEIFKEIHLMIRHPLKGLIPLGFAYAKLGEKNKALESISKIYLIIEL